MNTRRCDVLVIGGGPAGLSAAVSAARAGLDVICIEKKANPGLSIHCAEGIASSLLRFSPFVFPPSIKTRTISGIWFRSKEMGLLCRGKEWEGFSIDRSALERWLFRKARLAGAEMWFSSTLQNLEVSGLAVRSARILRDNEVINVRPQFIIAADGVESHVAAIMFPHASRLIANVVEWEYQRLQRASDLERVFFGEFSPTGYGFIFPKSRNAANIGAGSAVPWQTAEKNYHRFLRIAEVDSTVKTAERSTNKSGSAAISSDVPWRLGNVFFCGDAVSQNLKPLIEGILPAIIGGDFAARSVRATLDGQKAAYSWRSSPISSFYAESKLFESLLPKIFSVSEKTRYLLLLGLVSGSLAPNRYGQYNRLSANALGREISRSTSSGEVTEGY